MVCHHQVKMQHTNQGAFLPELCYLILQLTVPPLQATRQEDKLGQSQLLNRERLANKPLTTHLACVHCALASL